MWQRPLVTKLLHSQPLESTAKPDLGGVGGFLVTELPAMHLPAWMPSSLLQEQDALALFHFQVLCPEANPERGLVLVVLGIEPGMKGQIPLLA